MYNYSLQSFQWFSLACRCGKACSLRPGKKGFLTTAKWDPERFQSAASMSVLVILSYPWQETISFLNINQKWSQATDFTSRSKFGAVQIWPDVLGLGPGLTLPTKQFDISSSGKLSSPVQSHPQGPAPCCPKLPSWSGFSKSTRLVCRYCSCGDGHAPSIMRLWHFCSYHCQNVAELCSLQLGVPHVERISKVGKPAWSAACWSPLQDNVSPSINTMQGWSSQLQRALKVSAINLG